MDFYDKLPCESQFERLTDDASYVALPDDWLVGVADVVGSTKEVAAGRYKTVNMVGAAIISAVMNALAGDRFPFVFGGDGASFAVSAEHHDKTRAALAAVAVWADAEFNIRLRVALVPVADIRQAGYEVKIARFQASQGADYAMFSGGGLTWAEVQMKQGAYAIAPAAADTVPDLTGLSCRWAHMPAQQGAILSVVLSPCAGAKEHEVQSVYREVIAIVETLDRGGHPAPDTGMSAKWPPAGAALEATARRGHGSFGSAKRKALFESFVAWLLIRTGWTVGGFDARSYARIVAQNADFRKLDDGLKMTIDCDAKTQDRLRSVLTQAAARNVIRFGISEQNDAMMTCIVPSIMTDDHVHFIDGAAGGYTQAATYMKNS